MTLLWWERYRTLQRARAARSAHEIAARADDWSKLPNGIIELMKWANDGE